jgi:hypothetical protein
MNLGTRLSAERITKHLDDRIHCLEGDATIRRTGRANRTEGNIGGEHPGQGVAHHGETSLLHRARDLVVDHLPDDRWTAGGERRDCIGWYAHADVLMLKVAETSAQSTPT